MNRKYGSDYDLYKLSRVHKGKKGSSPQIAKLFGFSKKTYVYRSRIYKFVAPLEYKHPRQFWMVRDVVAIPRHALFDLNIKRGFAYSDNFRHEGQVYFLLPAHTIPFWAMKEYGGKY